MPADTAALRADVLVIGAGNAGLTAAARAASRGANVVVVEIAQELGGSAAYAGFAWTAPTHEAMTSENPRGDVELRRKIVDEFPLTVEWIRSLGVLVGPPVTVAGIGRGHQFDTMHYMGQCARIVTETGGRLLFGATTESLRTEGDQVLGADVVLRDGSRLAIRADSTVLATGGFQANAQLRAERIHPNASRLTLRSNPNSKGDGLRLAEAAGAATGPDDAGFYGHLVPAGIDIEPTEFVLLALYYSEHALLFNLHNERFVDETLGDHFNAIALMKQPEARGLLVADSRVHRDWMTTAYVEGAVSIDKYALASRRGARCGYAETLDELAYIPKEWGFDGEAILRAVATFNDRARDSDATVPARTNDTLPLDKGPFYVIECTPGITFTFHGIQVDTSARVLDAAGQPVNGLFAAGADVGGAYNNGYAGGIALGLVFGLAAADTATTRRV